MQPNNRYGKPAAGWRGDGQQVPGNEPGGANGSYGAYGQDPNAQPPDQPPSQSGMQPRHSMMGGIAQGAMQGAQNRLKQSPVGQAVQAYQRYRMPQKQPQMGAPAPAASPQGSAGAAGAPAPSSAPPSVWDQLGAKSSTPAYEAPASAPAPSAPQGSGMEGTDNSGSYAQQMGGFNRANLPQPAPQAAPAPAPMADGSPAWNTTNPATGHNWASPDWSFSGSGFNGYGDKGVLNPATGRGSGASGAPPSPNLAGSLASGARMDDGQSALSAAFGAQQRSAPAAQGQDGYAQMAQAQARAGADQMADGGIVTKPTLVMLAEHNQPEAVVPLDGHAGSKITPGMVQNRRYRQMTGPAMTHQPVGPMAPAILDPHMGGGKSNWKRWDSAHGKG